MEGRGNLIAAAVIILLILAVVLGSIFYLTKTLNININPFSSTNKATLTIKTSPTPSGTPSTIQPRNQGTNNTLGTTSPQPLPNTSGQIQGNDAIYTGLGFQVLYPESWGVLTCTNSQNFELDPY